MRFVPDLPVAEQVCIEAIRWRMGGIFAALLGVVVLMSAAVAWLNPSNTFIALLLPLVASLVFGSTTYNAYRRTCALQIALTRSFVMHFHQNLTGDRAT